MKNLTDKYNRVSTMLAAAVENNGAVELDSKYDKAIAAFMGGKCDLAGVIKNVYLVKASSFDALVQQTGYPFERIRGFRFYLCFVSMDFTYDVFGINESSVESVDLLDTYYCSPEDIRPVLKESKSA